MRDMKKKKKLSPSLHEGNIQPNDCKVEKQTGKVCVKQQHALTAFFSCLKAFMQKGNSYDYVWVDPVTSLENT